MEVPMGILRPSEQKYYEQENAMTKTIQNEGIYLSLVSQLDKLARHNRQGSGSHGCSPGLSLFTDDPFAGLIGTFPADNALLL